MESRLISLAEVDLKVMEQGAGPALIFIHPYAADLEIWQEQIRFFAGGFRCIAYDLRGHGGSSTPYTGYGIQNHTGDLLRVMEGLGVESASLIGLSMGGGIALSVALNHPEKVNRLVLASSTLGGLPWEEGMWRHFRDFEAEAREMGVQVAVDRIWMQGPLFAGTRRYPGLQQKLRRMAERFTGGNIFDRAQYPRPQVPDCQRLGEVRCPTLVMRGEIDAPEFIRRASLLAAGIPGARSEIISGAGHFLNLEAPGAFNRVVQTFLMEG